MKTVEHFGVQPHSQGPIYPAVIMVSERYTDAGALDFRSYVLILDGRREEYATHEDAETVARALLANPALRAQWRDAGAAYAPKGRP